MKPMREINNINWNYNRTLPFLENYKEDKKIDEDDWSVSFDWNGHKLVASVSFGIEIIVNESEGDRDTPTDETVEAGEIELGLIKLYYDDFDDFECDVREFQDIQDKLRNELKVMY